MDIDLKTILAEQRPLAEALAAKKNVIPEIDPDDMLFDFFIRHIFPTNHPQAIDAYFNGGEDCARKFAALCREHLQSEPQTVLEFASGYGRVARYAKHVLPETRWTSSDVHPKAVDFIADRIGLESFVSPGKPDGWTVDRKFNVVFALSFFSHMPDALFGRWLERVFSAVERGGILVFTTHGPMSVKLWQTGGTDAKFDEAGYYWNFNTEQLDIDTNDYGTSAVTLAYVQRALAALPKAELIRFQQAFWWGHQDLYVIRKIDVG